MKNEVRKILDENIFELGVNEENRNNKLEMLTGKIMDVFFDGKPGHIITMGNVKKVRVENGWLYNIQTPDSPINFSWSFVPKIVE